MTQAVGIITFDLFIPAQTSAFALAVTIFNGQNVAAADFNDALDAFSDIQSALLALSVYVTVVLALLRGSVIC